MALVEDEAQMNYEDDEDVEAVSCHLSVSATSRTGVKSGQKLTPCHGTTNTTNTDAELFIKQEKGNFEVGLDAELTKFCVSTVPLMTPHSTVNQTVDVCVVFVGSISFL